MIGIKVPGSGGLRLRIRIDGVSGGRADHRKHVARLQANGDAAALPGGGPSSFSDWA
jgi:hypothetical protein